jgi:hypothetical protein
VSIKRVANPTRAAIERSMASSYGRDLSRVASIV